MNVLSRTETLSLLSLSAACIGVISNTFQGDGEPLIASLAFSGIAYAFSFCLIRWLGDTFIRAGLKGKDMSKARKPEMFETFMTLWIFKADCTDTARKRWARYAQSCIFW